MSRARFAWGVPVAMAADMVLFSMLRRARPPAFDVIEDLEPYLAERRRFILGWLRFWES